MQHSDGQCEHTLRLPDSFLACCCLSDLRFSFVTMSLAQVKTTVRVSPITFSLFFICCVCWRIRSDSGSGTGSGSVSVSVSVLCLCALGTLVSASLPRPLPVSSPESFGIVWSAKDNGFTLLLDEALSNEHLGI